MTHTSEGQGLWIGMLVSWVGCYSGLRLLVWYWKLECEQGLVKVLRLEGGDWWGMVEVDTGMGMQLGCCG